MVVAAAAEREVHMILVVAVDDVVCVILPLCNFALNTK